MRIDIVTITKNEKVERENDLDKNDLILLSSIGSLKIRNFNPEVIRKYRILLFKINNLLKRYSI